MHNHILSFFWSWPQVNNSNLSLSNAINLGIDLEPFVWYFSNQCMFSSLSIILREILPFEASEILPITGKFWAQSPHQAAAIITKSAEDLTFQFEFSIMDSSEKSY